jgi:hypothetical protein
VGKMPLQLKTTFELFDVGKFLQKLSNPLRPGSFSQSEAQNRRHSLCTEGGAVKIFLHPTSILIAEMPCSIYTDAVPT